VTTVVSPFTGRVLSIEDVPDEVFAQRIVGDGAAVVPTEGTVVAPIAGRIEKLFEGGHAFAIQNSEGLQILVHVGLETVRLKGDGFTEHAKQGDDVSSGDHIVSVDLEAMDAHGIDMSSPVVVISGQQIRLVASAQVEAGEPLYDVS
jgi:glucose-specific phosphotransferase system IIA component